MSVTAGKCNQEVLRERRHAENLSVIAACQANELRKRDTTSLVSASQTHRFVILEVCFEITAHPFDHCDAAHVASGT